MNSFASIDLVLESLVAGRIVIVVDSEDRENEGDFLVAAEKISPAAVHFMATHGRGQLCMPITPQTAERLKVQPLVASNSVELPQFGMPLDHFAVSSGISPRDRALTIRAIADTESRADDFHRPGHVFPLIGRPGGVLSRPGHTESAIDLTRLAGLEPAGVLCEICSSDGLGMAGAEELKQLARRFNLPIIGIDALIQFQRERDTQVLVR